jgi:hypothetical protein
MNRARAAVALVVGWVLLLGGGAEAAGDARAAAKKHYLGGLKAFAGGHEDEAVVAFYEALAVDPTFADPHRALGTVLARTGDMQGMCIEFTAYVLLAAGAGDTRKIRAEMRVHAAAAEECDLDAWLPEEPEPMIEGSAPAKPAPSLEPGAVADVLARARPAVARCAAKTTATVLAWLTVGADGRVGRVDVRGPLRERPAGACIGKVLGALRFAKNDGHAAPVPAVFGLK